VEGSSKKVGTYWQAPIPSRKSHPFFDKKTCFSKLSGPDDNKMGPLSQSRFCICYENARDIPGYLTEKIFDCVFAGCIPVYWGEPNIQEWIPPECFVDFRAFGSYHDLYQYLTSMTEQEFIFMQKAGREFILSQDFKIHNSESFSKTVIDKICNLIFHIN
jgi:hypothetical protein